MGVALSAREEVEECRERPLAGIAAATSSSSCSSSSSSSSSSHSSTMLIWRILVKFLLMLGTLATGAGGCGGATAGLVGARSESRLAPASRLRPLLASRSALALLAVS